MNTLSSVTDLMQRIADKEDRFFKHEQGHFLCYRGQSDEKWGLIPSMFRNVSPEKKNRMVQIERDIYRDFQDMARPFAAGRFNLQDPWEMLCFAQHYGVPTRLLDWTSNPLVGLYFAVFESDNPEIDAALWCLNITKALEPKTAVGRSYMRAKRIIDLRVDLPFFEGLVKETTLRPSTEQHENSSPPAFNVIQAPDINDRIRNQGGLFSVYIPPHNNDNWDHNDAEFQYPKEETLLKLVIPSMRKDRIRLELEHLGMTPDQIYPDLEGVGKFLKFWRFRRLESRSER